MENYKMVSPDQEIKGENKLYMRDYEDGKIVIRECMVTKMNVRVTAIEFSPLSATDLNPIAESYDNENSFGVDFEIKVAGGKTIDSFRDSNGRENKFYESFQEAVKGQSPIMERNYVCLSMFGVHLNDIMSELDNDYEVSRRIYDTDSPDESTFTLNLSCYYWNGLQSVVVPIKYWLSYDFVNRRLVNNGEHDEGKVILNNKTYKTYSECDGDNKVKLYTL